MLFKKAKPLKDPTDGDHAYNYALFVLNISMRTEGEMREKMTRRGYLQSVVDEVIMRLQKDKYIDDERYAEIYLRNMKDFKSWGRFTMKQKMMLKKLPLDLIEQSLLEQFTKEEEQAIAERYVIKTFGELAEVAKLSYPEKQKIKQRLVSRGFGFDTIGFI